MSPAIFNINLQDETASGLLSSASSESLAQNPAFIRRDGRDRSVRFLAPSGDGTFDDAGVDGSSLVEVAIGTPDDPPTSGTFGLSYLGDSTGLTALAYNITAAALETALNANPAITAAGGVKVTKDDGLYIIAFNTVGARSLLVFSKGTLSPSVISTNNVLEVQTGDASTQEVQVVVLKKGYLAYSSDFAQDASGSISQTNVQTGTASVPQITRIAITGNVKGGSWILNTAQAQVVKVYCPSGTTGYLGGGYFILHDATGSVGVWINSGSTTMPAAVAACDRSIEITGVLIGDTSTQVATKLTTIIDADAQFTATSSSAIITITQVASGARSAPTTSGVYGVAETTAGYSIAASFPYDATAQTISAQLGTLYYVNKVSAKEWELTGRTTGAQAALTLTSNLLWQLTWTGTLSLSTWAMYVEFATAGTDEITRTFEVQVTEPSEQPIKALSISCTIRRDVIDVGNLTTATSSMFGYFNSTITGYTGGTATDLDSLVTTNRAVPCLLAFDHASFGGKVFKLRAGTDAESSPAIIRPDDYNASTNAKVWQAFQ
jgi:hypothetical protein